MRTEELKQGVRDGMPICLGYFSVSAAYGMTAVLSGLPLSAAVVILSLIHIYLSAWSVVVDAVKSGIRAKLFKHHSLSLIHI